MQPIKVNNLDDLDKWVLNLDQEPTCDQDCASDNRCDTCPFREGAD